ncbi:MAG: GGDEF domain-containing protein [Candidatus Eisenbacteria bacterium]|uniref:GGDEF domain-containing protein n=1 Tax=Eiseniibacteriota bacterium TaxID=2212470 RepID=A0A948RRV2_UNCEI|nr:GGDEF domain-containing protein [Candidatus Eisenbacteria bacterium]MBU1950801.1 GGDEF domain-containing protein [Candidatus Eisenbacteria bacterium]MBU2689715.1 GGDEF domain-containing protein [Candidatus Eisenbacteria bacterium]
MVRRVENSTIDGEVVSILKRRQGNYSDLLRYLLDIPQLPDGERDRICQALDMTEAAGLESITRDLIESLIERGQLKELPTATLGTRQLEDMWNHRIYHLSDFPPPLVRRIYPPPSEDRGTAKDRDALWGGFSPDDISIFLDPRELITRLESDLKELLGATRCLFHPIQVPEEWTGILREQKPHPVIQELAEEASRRPGEMLYVPDLLRLTAGEEADRAEGSLLILGLGSRERSWLGAVEWHAPQPGGFPPEVRARAFRYGRVMQYRLTASFRLQALVFRDLLTGIYNRAYFEDQMEKEMHLALRKNEVMGLCIIDIDDFKSYNTRFGYAGGDRVLQEVALKLRASLRASDTLARYGGDEFAALLAAPFSPDEGPQIAARIREVVTGLRFPMVTMDGVTVESSVSVSLGGALCPRDASSLEELWKAANRNLLNAKTAGKNRWIFP